MTALVTMLATTTTTTLAPLAVIGREGLSAPYYCVVHTQKANAFRHSRVVELSASASAAAKKAQTPLERLTSSFYQCSTAVSCFT